MVLARQDANPLPPEEDEPEAPDHRPRRQHQNRLNDLQIAELVERYRSGATVRELMSEFSIGRTTTLDHLKRAGLRTRTNKRRLTSVDVERAAELYAAGGSLATVGKVFKVDARTIGREFMKAGIATRPRLGR